MENYIKTSQKDDFSDNPLAENNKTENPVDKNVSNNNNVITKSDNPLTENSRVDSPVVEIKEVSQRDLLLKLKKK